VLSLLEGENFYEPSGINEVDASGILVNAPTSEKGHGEWRELKLHRDVCNRQKDGIYRKI
jgi:hypothetical protein